MYCIRCGNQRPDDAQVCNYCGNPVGQSGNQGNGYANGNYNNGYNNMNYNNGYQGQPQPNFGYQMSPQANSTFKNLLIFCIVELVCCNQITGVIALILLLLGKNGYSAGDFEKFEKYTKYAKYTLIIGVILSLLCGVFYLGLGVMGTAVDIIF